MEGKCPFCGSPHKILENPVAFAVYDTSPVSSGHLLVIPNRHYPSLFESTQEEIDAIFDLLQRGKELLDALYNPDGYNVGVNVGTAAGQSVMHLHVHLIQRFFGDAEDPVYGVRGVIPARQKYPSAR
ncbi:MAG: HIT family protein [Syntrophobacteraceae bacterium]|jgi:diadenosine tetraphosphate (Ap4A) HIT family hydrolase